jgi:hypothetical protein
MIKYSIDLRENTILTIVRVLTAESKGSDNKEVKEALSELYPQYDYMHKRVYGY